jgi:NAD(P)H-dependent FMN reductase
MNYLFLLGSTRAGGNTEALARLAAEQLPADVKQTWLRLSDLPIEPFKDIRHEGDGVYPHRKAMSGCCWSRRWRRRIS